MNRRALLLALAFALACGTPGDPAIEYAPFAGDAYPGRRVPLPTVPLGLTSDNGSDTVSAIDLATGKRVAAARVGRDPIENDGPHHLAVDPAAGAVYLALAYPKPSFLPGPHAEHASATRSGQVVKLSLRDLSIVGEAAVDANPGEIVLSDDGKRLVVTHFDLARATKAGLSPDDRRATMAILDPSRIDTDGTYAVPRVPVCVAPHGAALSRPTGVTAYVACYGEDAVAIVEDEGRKILRIAVGAPWEGGAPRYGPYSAVLSPTGDRVAVGCTESKDVRVLDARARAMSPLVVPTPGAPFFAAWSADGARLLVPTQSPDAVRIVDATTGATVKERAFDRDVCEKPHEVDLAPGGGVAYVVCEGDHKAPGAVLAIDPDTLETRGRTEVGVYPDRLAFTRPR